MENVMHWVKRFMNRLKDAEGVTLIELLAVVVILAIIAAVAVPAVLGQISKSKLNADKQNEQVIVDAIQRMVLDEEASGATNIAITQSNDSSLPTTSTDPTTMHVDSNYTATATSPSGTSVKSDQTSMSLVAILTQGLPGSNGTTSTPYLSQWPVPQSVPSGSTWQIVGSTSALTVPSNAQAFTIGNVNYYIAP